MILLVSWWVLLVCAYLSGYTYLHYADLCEREMRAGKDLSAQPALHFARVTRRSKSSAISFAILSFCCLLLHFLTPRSPVRMGSLGNTTI